MKKLSIFKVFIFAVILIFAYNSIQAKSKTIKPVKNKKLAKVLIDKKQTTYYMLSSSKQTVLSIDGPGELKILSRALIMEKRKLYTIYYEIDGIETGKISVNSASADSKAIFIDNPIPELSKLNKSKIKIGTGYHTIKLKLDKSSADVIAKFSFNQKKSKKHKWIEFQPTNKCESVSLIVNESPVSYLRFTKSNPMKISINGPTDLKVLTRNENNYEMRGRINYRISVKEDGKVLNTYLISTERSETAVYKENDKLVPGKAKDFIIKVPKGKHTYEIIPLDNEKSTLLGKILIPQKSANITE